jgi:hypothetical protein
MDPYYSHYRKYKAKYLALCQQEKEMQQQQQQQYGGYDEDQLERYYKYKAKKYRKKYKDLVGGAQGASPIKIVYILGGLTFTEDREGNQIKDINCSFRNDEGKMINTLNPMLIDNMIDQVDPSSPLGLKFYLEKLKTMGYTHAIICREPKKLGTEIIYYPNQLEGQALMVYNNLKAKGKTEGSFVIGDLGTGEAKIGVFDYTADGITRNRGKAEALLKYVVDGSEAFLLLSDFKVKPCSQDTCPEDRLSIKPKEGKKVNYNDRGLRQFFDTLKTQYPETHLFGTASFRDGAGQGLGVTVLTSEQEAQCSWNAVNRAVSNCSHYLDLDGVLEAGSGSVQFIEKSPEGIIKAYNGKVDGKNANKATKEGALEFEFTSNLYL